MASTQKDSKIQHVENAVSASAIEKWLVKKLLLILGKPHIFIALPDGTKISVCDTKPSTGMRILDRTTLWQFIANPGLNFGEAFSDGRIQVKGDLVSFLQNIITTRPKKHEKKRLSHFLLQGLRKNPQNSLGQSQDNIHHHYDIGNDFYKLWLDEEMIYTCAYFPDVQATLEQAQFAKLDYICRKLRLKAGETVVEAGCGWGGLARHMAKHYGVKVRAYNVSHAQISEARRKTQQQGLAGQIEYVEDDYRNIKGNYDVFVSIGMLEHVGTANYHTLCKVIVDCLSDHGRGLIHSIAQNEPVPMNPWLVKRIFPGGYTPTLREMMEVLEPGGFSVIDVENLRLHYARTLMHWLDRFNQHEKQISTMYDDNFVRAWRLYLAGSIANFSCGDLNLFQILFTHPSNNNIPQTRAYLYTDEEDIKKDTKAWKRVKS